MEKVEDILIGRTKKKESLGRCETVGDVLTVQWKSGKESNQLSNLGENMKILLNTWKIKHVYMVKDHSVKSKIRWNFQNSK